MKQALLFGSIALASGLLFLNLYNSLIDARSWSSNIPESIGTAREYFKTTNPGNFFRIFSPVNQILALAVLVLFWRSAPSVRLYLGIAFALYVFCDVLTFAYFYPRNEILFNSGSLTDSNMLGNVLSQWKNMTWLRTIALMVGVFFSFLSLHKIYLTRGKVVS